MRNAFENIYKGTEEFPIGIFDTNTYIPDTHFHMEFELFYLTEGCVTCGIGNNTYELHPGDVVFIAPGVNHYIQTKNSKDKFHYYAIVFDTSVFGTEKEATRKVFNNVIINNRLNLSDYMLERIRDTTKQVQDNCFAKEIIAKHLLYELFIYIVNTNQYAPLPGTLDTFVERKSIDRSLVYINDHYRENISLKDILEASQYSKSHFIKLFKASTGMNYSDYLNKFRVEKACRDLIYTNKNITEVATENGFNNIQYFSKIFKKYMDCTPKQYQKKWRVPIR